MKGSINFINCSKKRTINTYFKRKICGRNREGERKLRSRQLVDIISIDFSLREKFKLRKD